MNKILNRTINCIFLIAIVCSNFCVPTVAHAKTINELEKELTAKQNEYNQNQQKKAQTQAEINRTNGEINNIKNSINQTYIDIDNLNKEIKKLDEDIKTKEKQIKEVINYTQVSNGEEAYLEYAFGATDFTDFIYRMAIAEQLTNYNKKLIKEFNEAIETSKKKQVEIANKRTELEKKQIEMQMKLATLGKELSKEEDITISIREEIAHQKEVLEYYKSLGCDPNADVSTCGRAQLPPGTALFRPIASGYVTSFYGQRSFDYHRGIDVSTSVSAPPVYAAGNGIVVDIWNRFSCGGNMVFIQHKINGVKYTTLYGHLLSINVKIKDVVTRNTVIGYMGGGSNTFGWDGCSTGQHLHFQLAQGLYDPMGNGDYSSYSSFTAHTINPQDIINFPNTYYSWFTDRNSVY